MSYLKHLLGCHIHTQFGRPILYKVKCRSLRLTEVNCVTLQFSDLLQLSFHQPPNLDVKRSMKVCDCNC